eukprot:GILK01004445.1.p1 GENE.GILK01004445.1~~GILK01004445.1.p1  ORF type:complete len:352 (-),score=54.66 GILK01004445.1:190-1200(-)
MAMLYRYCPWDGNKFKQDELNCVVCGNFRFQRASSANKIKQNTPGVPWKKNLYDKQPYDDSYFDDTFLESMVTNANVSSYDYGSMVKNTLAVTQEISALSIFFVVFAHTLSGTLSERFLLVIDVVLLVIGFLAKVVIERNTTLHEITSRTKSAVIIIITTLLLSPVLQTLTKTYSNDTIYALTISLSVLHVMLFDFTFINVVNTGSHFSHHDEARSAGSISLNAAMFSAVLLASRLPSLLHVFVFVFFAIIMFAYFPVVRRAIKGASEDLHHGVTSLMFVVTALLLWRIATILALVYISGIVFITFLSPLWLLWVQKYKNEIQGPWDIPTVRNYQS